MTATPDVRRWTGISAFAVAVFMLLEAITKLTTGTRPELTDSEALIAHSQATIPQTIIVILADTFLMAFLIVFLACFRRLITREHPQLQWIADITFGAGIVFIAVTLVGDSMEGGVALDAMGDDPNATVIRTLLVGHSVMFGSTGAVLLALVSASAAYLTFATTILPSWTGYLAGATALSNLVWAVLGFGGTSDEAFFAAGGIGNAMLAIFPWLVWVFCVGLVTVRGTYHHEQTAAA